MTEFNDFKFLNPVKFFGTFRISTILNILMLLSAGNLLKSPRMSILVRIFTLRADPEDPQDPEHSQDLEDPEDCDIPGSDMSLDSAGSVIR